jgi:hypothetical protein
MKITRTILSKTLKTETFNSADYSSDLITRMAAEYFFIRRKYNPNWNPESLEKEEPFTGSTSLAEFAKRKNSETDFEVILEKLRKLQTDNKMEEILAFLSSNTSPG